MVNFWVSTAALAVLFMSGCSAGKPPEPAATAAPPPPTVFDPLTQNIQKAKDVQKAVDANTDATRRAVDQQESGDGSR